MLFKRSGSRPISNFDFRPSAPSTSEASIWNCGMLSSRGTFWAKRPRSAQRCETWIRPWSGCRSKCSGLIDSRFVVLCNGRRVPLHPGEKKGEFVAGVRYRAWQPPSCLHPNIPVHSPLVFDLVDTWSGHAIGGCTYHVSHPGGRANEQFPVNANEAESRRLARFSPIGHTPGPIAVATGRKQSGISVDTRFTLAGPSKRATGAGKDGRAVIIKSKPLLMNQWNDGTYIGIIAASHDR